MDVIWTHGGLVRHGLGLASGGKCVSGVDVERACLARSRSAEKKDARVLVGCLDHLVQHRPGWFPVSGIVVPAFNHACLLYTSPSPRD